MSHATNDVLLPDTVDDSGATIPSAVSSFRGAWTKWAAAVNVGSAVPRLRTTPNATTSSAVAGTDTIDAYLQKYPGAAARIQRRGGGSTLMPNLPLSKDEIGQLIAYLKYTSSMNTEGWPPKVEAGTLDRRLQLAHGTIALAQAAPAAAATPAPASDPAALGAQLVKDYGCVACHASDDKKLVGPGWGGLYESSVSLADGGKVSADDAYLAESIRQPNAKIVACYPPGVMPAYDTLLKND